MMDPKQAQQYWARQLTKSAPVNRGSWQAQKTNLKTYEANGVSLDFDVPDDQAAWANMCAGDTLWAEEHFQERVGGRPLNPAPSYRNWPWHSKKHQDDHTHDQGRFDHTYPERYWPKYPEDLQKVGKGYPADAKHDYPYSMRGIRFAYGDLRDVVNQLSRDPFTRQAYLPVFFPEDTGATSGQRVPCSLGYHFLRVGTQLDVFYFLRSCDLTRHFLNDMYMTGRLLQWVASESRGVNGLPYVGHLKVVISNLHLFVNDAWRFQ